jgi:tetratricopeptide (TPR) repeat protein
MIFISYRISDSLDLVGRLDADLTREFGVKHVFRDKTRLQAGKDWTTQLEGNAKTRKVMLVVIGPTWQTVTVPDGDLKGYPRLHDKDDWVRREITLALDAGNIVLPLFLTGATMPTKAWLKKCRLDRLHAKQGLPLRATDYDTDFVRLIEELRKQCLPPPPPPPPPPDPKGWRPGVAYPLQPAPHFSGREAVLKDLSGWAVAADDPNRVVALVAAGGTGKTAIAERVLASLSNHTTAGVFVWSFYEDPKTEAFLRAACEYFFGEAPKETGGLLERLQQGLRADNLPHLLVLDGLELVQASGTTGRPRGELEDPLMKRFLRWLAAGLGTRAKALITSRFPLPDLADWKGHGFRPIDLADLDPLAARAVLRRWGVRGTDTALDALSGSVHQHALTVDVLGSYLGTFHGGDPTQAPSFDPQFLADTDPKTARLHRVLTSYAEKLPPRERDLLARLSVFPRGVGVDVIGYLIDAGGEVAATLVGCGQAELLKLLLRLKELGLVFRYDIGKVAAFTAHPFLRGFFEKLLGINDPKQIHETVRAKLAAGLDERPDKKPTDSAELDRYERLIEVTRLAGEVQKAFDLYWYGMGSHNHLGWVLGDYTRGLRILAGFAADGTPATVSLTLQDTDRALLANEWGLYATHVGDLPTGRQSLDISRKHITANNSNKTISVCFQNIAEVELIVGCWPAAREAAATAVLHAERSDDVERTDSHAYLATALNGLGLGADAQEHFTKATQCQDKPLLYSLRGIQEAEWKLAKRDQTGALAQTEANSTICRRNGWTQHLALCETLLGRCALPEEPAQARSHLTAAREYASRSGDIHVTLRSYHLAAEIARHEKNFPLALSEALDGIQLADSCGFGRWSLVIRTELAKIHLAAGELAKAIEPAEWVLKRSEEPECQYAWGVADSLHLLGVAHARMRGKANKAKARDYLQRAVEKRRAIEHGELKESEDELQKLG